MITIDTGATVGTGGPRASLTAAELEAIVEQALADVHAGARVLAIVPDATRDDNTPELFPIASRVLDTRRVGRFDALVAQGTHPPMTDAEKQDKIGRGPAGLPRLGRIFDHRWDDPSALTTIGELGAEQVATLTGGLMRERVSVQVNSLVAGGEYDTVLVFGATMPHEVAGFAGGAKYFFPGVSGPELTHMTHWLGALATIPDVIGRVETPTRRVIEAAARLIPPRIVSLNSVSIRDGGRLQTRALFAGDLFAAFRQAAEISRQVHIRYTNRRYRRVVALLDPHYRELWVGGKASYKLGAIVEQGGELIVYAPHLTEISVTHGRLIEKYGYAPLEQVRDMVAGSDELRANLCVAAHLAHVSYASARGSDGSVLPRYRITLASAISEEACRRVKLGYLDCAACNIDEYRMDPDTLVVEDAGRDLSLLASDA
jgi:nickel-dependent lactate racemase